MIINKNDVIAETAVDANIRFAAEQTKKAIEAFLLGLTREYRRDNKEFPYGAFTRNVDDDGEVFFTGNPYLYISGGSIVRLMSYYMNISDQWQKSTAHGSVVVDFDVDFYYAPDAFSTFEARSHKRSRWFTEGSSQEFAKDVMLTKSISLGPFGVKKIQFVLKETMDDINDISNNVSQFDISAVRSFFYKDNLYLSQDTIDALITRKFTYVPGTHESRIKKYTAILQS